MATPKSPVPKSVAPKFVAQVGNIYFLAQIGSALRWATSEIARAELPDDIQRLLRKLDRLESREPRKASGNSQGNGQGA